MNSETKPKRNALIIGEGYVNWDVEPNLPNMEYIDNSSSTMNVAAAGAAAAATATTTAASAVSPTVFNGPTSFEPRMILRVDPGVQTKITLETNRQAANNAKRMHHHHHVHQLQSRVAVKVNENGADNKTRETVICENTVEDDYYYEDEASKNREQWTRKTEFLLAIIGFSVDLGNVWRCKHLNSSFLAKFSDRLSFSFKKYFFTIEVFIYIKLRLEIFI